ncbi:MAG: lipoprotein-releasing ABC transporter ATP-binding protein LolD [Pantoea sp. Brub]|nr:lipoprotein-releasing ABC transporter ATP-binding protein LolD [Pantoea sp. Brub]
MNKIFLLQSYNLCKIYKEGNIQTTVLNNVNFNMKFGDYTSIIGNSGSGKSTLLHLLGGLDKPTSGDIIFEGKSLNAMSSIEKSKLHNQKLGFIYQFHHLLLDFNALENVAMPQLINNINTKTAKNNAYEILQQVGLAHRAKYYPAKLSGGERQRVAIARALVNKPLLVIADEPTGNLDIHNTNIVIEIFHKMNRIYGTAFLIVTHNLYVAQHTKYQLKINDGSLIGNV